MRETATALSGLPDVATNWDNFVTKETDMPSRPATIAFSFAGIAFCIFLTAAWVNGDDWPCWRGPHGDGIARETGLLQEWPAQGPKQLWNADLSGGFSSVVVADGRMFTQTKGVNEEVVVCLDVATGNDLWRYRYPCDYAAHKSFTGGGMPASRTGPRSTPTVDGDRVYTLGATGTFLCLETKTGKKVWQQDLLKLAETDCPHHGFCSCPLVVGDRIYLPPRRSQGQVHRRP
jgi:outer membrane protein assembly factor BamB